MAELSSIVKFLNRELEIEAFDDESLNGLQIEGQEVVTTVAVAVDAAQGTVEAAIKRKADLLIVHHGLFWGKALPITGPRKALMQSLFDSKLSLYAAHLPLDAHLNLGNNYALARLLALSELEPFLPYRGRPIGCRGRNSLKLPLAQIEAKLSALPGAAQQVFALRFGPKIPESVGIVSGSGADALFRLRDEGIDTLITGEPKQFAYHFARDWGFNAIFAGHYATETLGVQEVGRLLQEKFSIDWFFIDHPTGI